jgi:hypothetical protein
LENDFAIVRGNFEKAENARKECAEQFKILKLKSDRANSEIQRLENLLGNRH